MPRLHDRRIPTEEELYRECLEIPGGENGFLGLTVDREWRMVREFTPTNEEGGLARVWVVRLSAQCYRLTAGDIEMSTGSGSAMGVLMIRLALAISDGMVGFDNVTRPEGASA